MDRDKKYTYEDFLKIVRTLRSENGCPWDREQTHMSLRPCLTEEAAEVLAAIRIYEESGSFENLREELGDLLLQVVMHAQIAEEEGIFDMGDVVTEIAEKMVRRHPHVFGDTAVNGSAQVLQNWEEIKKKEKKDQKEAASPLREIPLELPALARAAKVLKKADRLYEPAADYETTIARLEKTLEFLKQRRPSDYDMEIAQFTGDLLMGIANISRICKLSPEQILTDKIEEVIRFYEDKK